MREYAARTMANFLERIHQLLFVLVHIMDQECGRHGVIVV